MFMMLTVRSISDLYGITGRLTSVKLCSSFWVWNWMFERYGQRAVWVIVLE